MFRPVRVNTLCVGGILYLVILFCKQSVNELFKYQILDVAFINRILLFFIDVMPIWNHYSDENAIRRNKSHKQVCSTRVARALPRSQRGRDAPQITPIHDLVTPCPPRSDNNRIVRH